MVGDIYVDYTKLHLIRRLTLNTIGNRENNLTIINKRLFFLKIEKIVVPLHTDFENTALIY